MGWSRLLVRLFLDAPDLLTQDAMLKGLHEMTARIEQLSQAEHDLIREVHPQVGEIKEHVENVAEAVAPESSDVKESTP